jgi:isoleucyl-tRNA synthetase
LGALHDFTPKGCAVSLQGMRRLDKCVWLALCDYEFCNLLHRYTMQRMIDLHNGVQGALKVHNTGKALQLVNNCVANDLSSLYYDCIKDTLCVHSFTLSLHLHSLQSCSGIATRA